MVGLVDGDEKVLDLEVLEEEVALLSDVPVRESVHGNVRVVHYMRAVCGVATVSDLRFRYPAHEDVPTTPRTPVTAASLTSPFPSSHLARLRLTSTVSMLRWK